MTSFKPNSRTFVKAEQKAVNVCIYNVLSPENLENVIKAGMTFWPQISFKSIVLHPKLKNISAHAFIS